MRAEEVWVEADRRNPPRDQPSILSGAHAAVATAATAEEMLAGFLFGGLDIVVDGLALLLGQLESDRSAGLLLPNHRAIDRIPARRHVLDPQCDHIAAPSLLSIARLNIARSRDRPSICSLVRIDQTCFGRNGRF
jgi:hypothetical protein